MLTRGDEAVGNPDYIGFYHPPTFLFFFLILICITTKQSSVAQKQTKAYEKQAAVGV